MDESKDTLIQTLRSELMRQQSQNKDHESLTYQFKDLEMRLEALATEKLQQEQRHARTLQNMELRIMHYQGQIKTYEEDIGTKQIQLEENETILDKVKYQYDQVFSEQERVVNKITQMDMEAHTLKEDNMMLQEIIEKKNQEIENLHQESLGQQKQIIELSGLFKYLKKLEKNEKKFNIHIQELKIEIIRKEEETAKVRMEVLALDKCNHMVEKEQKNVLKQLQKKDAQISQLQEQLYLRENNIIKVVNQVDKVKHSHDTLQAEYDELAKKYSDQAYERNQMNEENKQLKKQSQKLQSINKQVFFLIQLLDQISLVNDNETQDSAMKRNSTSYV